MFSRKFLIIFSIFLIFAVGFCTKISAASNGTTIEIHQDLTTPLISNKSNSLSIENNKVILLNNNLKGISLFSLSESDVDIHITLVNKSDELTVYKNGKKGDSISSKNIDISLLIDNLQTSYEKGEITHLEILSYPLSTKRVFKNYLDFSQNDLTKYIKEKIVIDNNLKLYYSASDIDGMSTFATSSTMATSWKNLSGNNNGTLTNFALTPASGWDGNNIYSNPSRLTFDGVNDYIQLADSSPFNFNTTTPFTFEFWINLATQPDNSFGYIFSRQPGYFQPGYEMYIFSNRLFVKLNALSGGIPRSISLLKSLPPVGAWTHLIVSYDGSSKASGVKIYYNGSLQSPFVSSDTLNSSDSFNSGSVRLGATAFGVRSFKGSLGDVRIYNKALSQSEVLQNYRSEQAKYFQGPSIASLSPTDNSTEVAIQSNLVITFDQLVSKGSGNIRIKKSSNNSEVETINVSSANVSISGKTVTINPTSNLSKNTSYYIEADENTFKYNGISFLGISDSTTWNFTTVGDDNVAPKIVSFNPENGSQDAPVATNLVITFDDNVYPGSGVVNIFDADSDDTEPVEIINANSNLVTGTGTNAITINPSMNLSSNTLYVIGIDSNAFQDGAGNNFKSNEVWLFSTVDTTPISVTSLSPNDDATNVSANANLEIKFNKAVTANTGNITIKKASDDTTVETISVTSNSVTGNETDTITINPSMDFAEDTSYYINIGANAFKDTAGNNYSGITDKVTWNFKTADVTTPTIMTLSPADGSSNVNVNSDFIIVFSEPVQAKTGNITITKLTAQVIPPVETISVTSNLVTGSGTDTITINPSMDLEEDIRYYINIDSTAFTDLSGNAFAGISNRSTWDFRTNDVTAPSITTLLPNNNATDVNVNSNLQLLFSEIVYPKKGNINIFNADGNVFVESIDVTSPAVIGSGTNSIVINPSMDFAENTSYFITIAQGAFADFYNNQFAGILDNTTWHFKTVVPENFGGGNVGNENNGDGNAGNGNNGGTIIGSCNFTQCEQLCCINGCCPSDPTTCIDFPNCLESSSSSGSSSISSSSSSSSGSITIPSLSSSSSGLLIFNSDGGLTSSQSPVTIVGPETVKLHKNKISFTVSHSNVQGVVNCSIAPIGQLKILSKPKNISFTPTKDKVKVQLKISPKERKKAKKDADKRNLQLKIICDDGEGNLDIKLEPKKK